MSIDSPGKFDTMSLFISRSFGVELDSDSEISIGCICIFALLALYGSEPNFGEGDAIPLEYLIFLWCIDNSDAFSRVLLQSDIFINLVNVLIDELIFTLINGERKKVLIADEPIVVLIHEEEAELANLIKCESKQGFK
jgi:hypothetical protein